MVSRKTLSRGTISQEAGRNEGKILDQRDFALTNDGSILRPLTDLLAKMKTFEGIADEQIWVFLLKFFDFL